VSAALAYRAQAPVLDGLMKELGLDGSSLGALAQGAAEEVAPTNDKSLVEIMSDVAEQVQEAEERLDEGDHDKAAE